MSAALNAQYLTLDGSLAFVEIWGAGQPVFCVHTAGQSGVQYREAAAGLARLGYRVIVPDLPGHGRSEPRHGGPVTDLGDYAAWCVQLIEALELVQPVIVGCSIGGKIALDIAARMGNRIHSVIAMAANAEAGHANVAGLRRELEDISAPSRSDRTYYGTRAVVGRAVAEDRRELIARMHCREDPQVSISDLLAWGRHDIFESLRTITAPARLVAGSDDLWINAESVERAAAEIPGAQYTHLDGIGHYPMEEMADFAEHVDRWVRDADRPRTGSRTALAGAALNGSR
ncbi:alpha/beta fold hydrolase [Pseudarthrobacter sp. H2]|uniref:alpha/beta fold hydrolase n=1 Tax=Pseudarthrobacter sp. H2 TaxID=3418415 RepID=UPI003CF8B96E